MTQESKFTVTLRGYDRREVEALLARIEWTLAGGAGHEAVSPEDVRDARFATTMRGYDQEEVDQFLEQVVERLDNVRRQRPTATQDRDRSDGATSGSSTAWFREASTLVARQSAPPGERFACTRWPVEGYRVEDVDAFVEHVRLTLTTRLRTDEIVGARFGTTRWGGYDIDEVDDWLDAVQTHVQNRQ